MIVSNCPRCGEAFRVPADELPDDAFAHCPWCRGTFPVSEVLKILPPVLEVLSADGTPFVPARHQAAALGIAGLSDTSARPGLVSSSEQADAGFLIDQATESSELDGEGLNFESPSSAETVVDEDTSESYGFGETVPNDFFAGDVEEPGNELESADHFVEFEVEDPHGTWERDEIAPMRVSPARARQNKGGGIGTAIKVVLGGILAVPLAGGLLMAMGRNPDWGFWPFNGSGESKRNVVAAPPADLSMNRGETSEARKPSGRMLNPDFGDEALGVADDPADLAREQIMAEPKVDDLSPNINNEADPPQADSPIVLPTANELAVNEPTLTDRADSAVSLDATFKAPGLEMPKAATDEAPISESEQPAVESLLPETETAEAIPAGQNATADDSAELVAIADRAGKMIEALSKYDGDPKERERRMLLTYEKIAIACNMATSDSKALSRLASTIKNSSLLDEIGGAASEWLIYSSRNSEGIVLVGQASTSDQGQIITLDSGTVLSVVGDMQLSTAERVLAMGRIIDENSVELVLTRPLP